MSLITTKNAVVYIEGKRIEVPKGSPLPEKVSKEDIDTLRSMGALPPEGAAIASAVPTPAAGASTPATPASPPTPAAPDATGKR